MRDQIKGIKDNSILDFLFFGIEANFPTVQRVLHWSNTEHNWLERWLLIQTTFSVDMKSAYYLETKPTSFLFPYKRKCQNKDKDLQSNSPFAVWVMHTERTNPKGCNSKAIAALCKLKGIKK